MSEKKQVKANFQGFMKKVQEFQLGDDNLGESMHHVNGVGKDWEVFQKELEKA